MKNYSSDEWNELAVFLNEITNFHIQNVKTDKNKVLESMKKEYSDVKMDTSLPNVTATAITTGTGGAPITPPVARLVQPVTVNAENVRPVEDEVLTRYFNELYEQIETDERMARLNQNTERIQRLNEQPGMATRAAITTANVVIGIPIFAVGVALIGLGISFSVIKFILWLLYQFAKQGHTHLTKPLLDAIINRYNERRRRRNQTTIDLDRPIDVNTNMEELTFGVGPSTLLGGKKRKSHRRQNRQKNTRKK